MIVDLFDPEDLFDPDGRCRCEIGQTFDAIPFPGGEVWVESGSSLARLWRLFAWLRWIVRGCRFLTVELVYASTRESYLSSNMEALAQRPHPRWS